LLTFLIHIMTIPDKQKMRYIIAFIFPMKI